LLARIAQHPFTTHSIRDFVEDMAGLEAEILAHPGQRPVRGAPPGWHRVGPSRIYAYSLIYRLKDGNAYIVATAAARTSPLLLAATENLAQFVATFRASLKFGGFDRRFFAGFEIGPAPFEFLVRQRRPILFVERFAQSVEQPDLIFRL
jgi:hypothetical protein